MSLFSTDGKTIRDCETNLMHQSVNMINIRFKDDVSMSEIVASQHRIRTYSDGLLIIDHIQPFDHGSYVCLISTLNGTSARSKPVHVTVRCNV